MVAKSIAKIYTNIHKPTDYQLGRKTPQGRGVSSTWSCRTSKVALAEMAAWSSTTQGTLCRY